MVEDDWALIAEISTVAEELRIVEARIGTGAERVDDFDRCCELGHRLRNLHQLDAFRNELLGVPKVAASRHR